MSFRQRSLNIGKGLLGLNKPLKIVVVFQHIIYILYNLNKFCGKPPQEIYLAQESLDLFFVSEHA